jgi:hypothetical protein
VLRHRFFLALLLLLLIVKVIAVVARGPSPLVLDASGYWELGELVAGGDWLLMAKPIAYRTPAYPWLIGIVQVLCPAPLFCLIAIQAAMWLAGIGLIASMAFEMTRDWRSVWIVLLIAAVMVSSVVYVTTVLTETLFVFLLLAHLWSVLRFSKQPKSGWAVLVGVTLGLAVLTRPIAMLLWIADAIFLLACWRWSGGQHADAEQRERTPRPRRWLHAAAAVLIAVLCLTPWLARNHDLFGKAMLTEFVGRNIWIVTFQDGSGAGLAFPDTAAGDELKEQLGPADWRSLQQESSWRHTWTMSHALTDSGLTDPAADRLMKQVALDAIAASPQPVAKKTARRFVNFWRTRATELPQQFADLNNAQVDAGQVAKKLYAGQAIWGRPIEPLETARRYRFSNWLTGNTLTMLLTAIAVLRLILFRQTRATGIWLGGILFYFAAVTAVLEIPAYRYRMIVEPVMLLTVAAAFVPLGRLTTRGASNEASNDAAATSNASA